MCCQSCPKDPTCVFCINCTCKICFCPYRVKTKSLDKYLKMEETDKGNVGTDSGDMVDTIMEITDEKKQVFKTSEIGQSEGEHNTWEDSEGTIKATPTDTMDKETLQDNITNEVENTKEIVINEKYGSPSVKSKTEEKDSVESTKEKESTAIENTEKDSVETTKENESTAMENTDKDSVETTQENESTAMENTDKDSMETTKENESTAMENTDKDSMETTKENESTAMENTDKDSMETTKENESLTIENQPDSNTGEAAESVFEEKGSSEKMESSKFSKMKYREKGEAGGSSDSASDSDSDEEKDASKESPKEDTSTKINK